LIAEYVDQAGPSFWVTNPLVFKEAYLPGATRNRVVDGLLQVLFWLTVFGVVGHGLLRVLTRTKRPRMSAVAERVKMYPVWLRFWHWSNAILFVVLAYTGVRIHFGQRRGPIMSFETAFNVHNLAGSLLVAIAILFFVGNVIGQNQRQYLSRPRDGLAGILRQLRWYLIGIFKGEPHPYHASPEHKFNPLQHLTYVGVMYVMYPLLLLSGVVLLFPSRSWNPFHGGASLPGLDGGQGARSLCGDARRVSPVPYAQSLKVDHLVGSRARRPSCPGYTHSR
jgi:thiosulfate reductase cytochrome b subunit